MALTYHDIKSNQCIVVEKSNGCSKNYTFNDRNFCGQNLLRFAYFFPTSTVAFHPSPETRDVSVRSFLTIDLFNLLFIAPTNFSGYKTNK